MRRTRFPTCTRQGWPARVLLLLALGLMAAWPGCAAAQTQPKADNPSFNLVNRGATAIRELYVTPAGDARWGENRLPGITIATGASYAVRRRIDGNCVFDIRAVFADGRIVDRRDVNTCAAEEVPIGGTVAPAETAARPKAPDDPSFRLVNRTTQPITEVYATPAGFGNWGANRLVSPLAPGGARVVRITRQGSCAFDLRVVFADHKAKQRRGTDLCRTVDLPVP